MELVNEHINLTNKILAGELSKEDVKLEIDRMENEYGESAFNLYKVSKKDAPWTQRDLDDLEVQSAAGALSKDFYLYMAEVSDFVHRKNKKNKWITKVEDITRWIAKHWLIVLIVIGLVAFVIYYVVPKLFGVR